MSLPPSALLPQAGGGPGPIHCSLPAPEHPDARAGPWVSTQQPCPLPETCHHSHAVPGQTGPSQGSGSIPAHQAGPEGNMAFQWPSWKRQPCLAESWGGQHPREVSGAAPGSGPRPKLWGWVELGGGSGLSGLVWGSLVQAGGVGETPPWSPTGALCAAGWVRLHPGMGEGPFGPSLPGHCPQVPVGATLGGYMKTLAVC